MNLLIPILALVIVLPLIVFARQYFAKTRMPGLTLIASCAIVLASTIFLYLLRDIWKIGGSSLEGNLGSIIFFYIDNLVFVVVNLIILTAAFAWWLIGGQKKAATGSEI